MDLIPWNRSGTTDDQLERIRENVDRVAEGIDQLEQHGGTPPASDAAAELANENGLDLRRVNGTGEDGRVLKSDVQDFLESLEAEEESSEED